MIRRYFVLPLCVLLFFLALCLQQIPGVRAQTDDLQKKIDEINELKTKIAQLQGQSRTLGSTIEYLNNKKLLTQKQIVATEYEIDLLEKEIDSLDGKIGVLNDSLDSLTRLLMRNVAATYKREKQSNFEVIFASDRFADAYAIYKYRKLAQDFHNQLLKKTTQAKVSYDAQKSQKEEKQQTIALLKKKLVVAKKDLEDQELAKRKLLVETKNSEGNYQKLLALALAEKNALENALISGKKVGPVKAGEAIALVGNSGYPGCSSGKHLHFEVRKNNTWVDPAPFLQNKSIIDEERGGQDVSLGSGSWSWPLEDKIRLTQHYGHTPWSWRYAYSGGIHTGLDMVSKQSDIIRAPADGVMYKSTGNCGGSSQINVVYIDHGENLYSFYLHVQ